MSFVFRTVEEVGCRAERRAVVMGDRLGYYRDLAANGPSTPAELAERTGTDEHYAREWLNAQAAGSFVGYDPGTARYTLPPEHAVALTDETSPAFVGGLFQILHGTVVDADRIVAAARTGDGVGWHEHGADVHVAASGSSHPAITRTWSRNGCPPSTASSTSSPAGARSPTSAAATVPRRS